MRKNILYKTIFASFIAVSLITTSLGGAFATAALAATPEEETQQVNDAPSNKAVLGGLAALGLIAMLANGGGSSDSGTAPDKSTSPPAPTPVPTAPAPAPTAPAPVIPKPTPAPTPSPTPSGLTADEQQAVQLMNADRAANGLSPLKVNLKLTGLARDYAQDMINRKFFSHYDPDGKSPFDRMRQYGISYRYAGENLAINGSVARAEQAFMNSPGHRANILNPNYTEIGIGVRYSSSGSVYVVQEFIGR